MINRTVSILSLLAWLTMPQAANAALISFDFTATYDRTVGTPAGGSLADTASAFAAISGFFSYDSATPNTNVSAAYSSYVTGVFSFNEFAFVPSGTTQIDVANDYFGLDPFVIETRDTDYRVFINLQDPTASAFDSEALPTVLELSSFPGVKNLGIVDNRGRGTVYFDLTSLTTRSNPPTIPLPATLLLVLTGLTGLRILRK